MRTRLKAFTSRQVDRLAGVGSDGIPKSLLPTGTPAHCDGIWRDPATGLAYQQRAGRLVREGLVFDRCEQVVVSDEERAIRAEHYEGSAVSRRKAVS
jgi:hypothetical protein